ncbi:MULTISPECIES: hypothetical protein [unclassified Gilliamella]|uniref:hypothetical protein n=1 Tax=unclassified Gilliamella TaxID=2685620 RepID=UPI00132378A7|nr:MULTISPECIES: hypothetical protein [unclassified Gilliamella]MWN32918.1 hypothetical protein [Gilliamella sp. Pra-s60]MWP30355.1 hypothetical protein [Gilliamella sp. Pra-s54]
MASGIWHLACPTYTLNLIDSHGRQKQAPHLFSSPKSFCVAKSTPLSATLSPISKLLSKPPLLPKSALLFVPLLLLPYTQGVQALSAYTSRAIEGSAPYLTFDGGLIKATNTDSLLSIKLPDGTRYMKSTNPSTPTKPIRLPNVGGKLSDITMIVPPSRSSITINDLVTQGNWGDDDGDGQNTGDVAASGSISVTFTDKNGNTVSRSDALSICSAPYRVRLESTNGTLITRYGVPRSSTFSGDVVDYYINPYNNAGICSVRPNLLFGGTTGIDSYDNPRYAGPDNIWNPEKGFLVQSTSSSSYDRNFPTTGSDGLYFDLDVGGVDASQLSWTVITSGSIRATVNWTRPRSDSHEDFRLGILQHDAWIRDKTKNVTRVTLKGPEARNQWSNSNPSRITVPSLPQTFELIGRDRSGNEVRYGFVLRQWFVNRGGQLKPYKDQLAWCNSLGYRMPRIRDLTNAKCGVVNYQFPCINGIDGTTPSSGFNGYKRHIGAGFFTEWGNGYSYADVDLSYDYYWTSDATDSDPFSVFSFSSAVNSVPTYFPHSTVCTTP